MCDIWSLCTQVSRHIVISLISVQMQMKYLQSLLHTVPFQFKIIGETRGFLSGHGNQNDFVANPKVYDFYRFNALKYLKTFFPVHRNHRNYL